MKDNTKSEIEELTDLLIKFRDARNWDQFHSPKNLSMGLAAEAAELLEIFQWLTEEQARCIVNDQEGMALVREEIADVFIYLVRLADKLGVDIEKAVEEKIKVNERKYPVELAKGNATKYNKR
jgi:NTP pyrophosphatase (non-canonical NTP hydrolase)